MVRPNKGTKRKSESPETEENVAATRKRYSTRSSNRKRMSYNESEAEPYQDKFSLIKKRKVQGCRSCHGDHFEYRV